MAFTSTTRSKLDDAQDQIARLRHQVEGLMRDRVQPAMSDYASRANEAVGNASGAMRGAMDSASGAMRGAMDSASGVMRDQAEMVSGRVREQPLIALLVAATVGWIIGRVMR
ncbi:hypothetical protein [Rhodopila globiformis]|uniref:DUF883 domain-containing protein n=1 Tax=Rhodopila globiformis TaxID=1071 RepID=A0A2S6N115_RHOGL|nr:hypothetical protein [Rhodopila globiformis]PPQ28315.1 hypothetical protein CCS01_24735 [Rhodopila globiformis]